MVPDNKTTRRYTVHWMIDIQALTARQACEEALRIQRDPKSSATKFDVISFEENENPMDYAQRIIDLSIPGES